MELGAFYKCLFNEDEAICLSTNPRGVSVYPISDLEVGNLTGYTFLSINPLLANEDRNPTESYHGAKIPRRADHNVSSYRNILIEMDKMPLEEQRIYMDSIRLPYSTCTFSGNKSYHFIISLKTPVESRKEYNRLVARVYKAVGADKVDQACKNPSRFTRVPGHLRRDTDTIQGLIEIANRIPQENLENWLLSRGVPPIIDSDWEDITYKRAGVKRDISSLSGATRIFLRSGKELTSGWNIALFKASADLCRNGWDEQGAREMLLQVTGTLDISDEKTIQSAFNNERNQNG